MDKIVDYVTAQKAAKITNTSVTRIYRFIHAGELVAYYQDGELLIDLKEFIRKNRRIIDSELLEPTFMSFVSRIENE